MHHHLCQQQQQQQSQAVVLLLLSLQQLAQSGSSQAVSVLISVAVANALYAAKARSVRWFVGLMIVASCAQAGTLGAALVTAAADVPLEEHVAAML
jgi:uncharacterized membrane protein YfcA